jgi:hypothetical protein
VTIGNQELRKGIGMAQIRFAEIVALAAITVGSLAGTGCISRDLNSHVKDGETQLEGKMGGNTLVAGPVALFASAVDIVGQVVTLPFTIPIERDSDTAKTWVDDPLNETNCRPVADIADNSGNSCLSDEG